MAVNDIKRVYILSLDGRVVESTDQTMHGSDHSGMEYFIKGKGGYSLDVFSSDSKGKVTNYLSAPIYHEGKGIGVIVMECFFECIESITKDYTGLGNTGESFLLRRDKDGDALYIVPLRFDPKAALKRKISRHDTHVAGIQALLKNERAYTDHIDYRGKPVLAATRYIRETDWGLVVKVDKEEAYAPLARLYYLTTVFLVITVILILALAFYLTRFFTRPILDLSNAARRISEGDLSVRAEVTSKDEIGELERYFNKMTEGLIAANLSLNEAQRIAHVGNWELDLVDNRLTWSDETYRIFEIDPKKFGASYEAFLDTIHPEDRAAVDLAYTNSVKTKTPYATEHRLLFPNGRIKYLHQQCETSYDSDGKPRRSVGIVQDITSRKQEEDKLRKSEERYHSTLDHMLEGCQILGFDWCYIYLNAAAEKHNRRPNEELLGRKYMDIWPGIEATEIFAVIRRCMEERIAQQMENEFIFPDGTIGWFQLSIQPVTEGIFILSQDITERKRAEEAMRESEKRYKRLVGSVMDYFYTVKVENGFPVHTSHGPGCVAVTGYTSDEYEADPDLWYRMVCEEDRKGVISHSVNLLSCKNAQRLEYRIIHKDGSIRWVMNTLIPKYNEEGRLIAYDGLISDITERRKLEEQLRHSQKMEVIGTLAGGISHDFNNILTAIMGYASLLKMHVKSDDPSSHHAEQILVLVDKAGNMTKGLLAFSRKQTIKPKPTDLDETIKRMANILRRIIGEDIELKTKLSDKKSSVMADSGQIEQVLMNLCINARDAMPHGGSLTIETDLVELDSEYATKHGYGKPGDYLLLSVTDTGVGMDEMTQEKIFEPFFTTKEPGKGTGLGLSMAYGIIKQHNGYINVSSDMGRGTRFDIYLPVIEPAEVRETRPQGQTVPAGGTDTILYAEDELFLREVTKEVLEEFGYKIIAAVDGEDAVEKFMNNKDKIQLLIFDAVMPKKNGKTAYDEIKRVKPDSKILFLSGHSEDVIHKNEIIQEGLTIVSKPVSPDNLLRKIREVLDR